MIKRILAYLLVGMLSLGLVSCGGEDTLTSSAEYDNLVASVSLQYENDPLAIIETNKGSFLVELFQEQTPATVENFIKLAEAGFYNGLKWHIVLPGIKIQTGDPTGTGTGSSNTTAIKLETHPDLRHDKIGVLGMARFENDLDSATSQFYITLDAESEWDRKYAIFGQVIQGTETLGAIEQNDLVQSISILKP